ncbi:MAG: hypothetical protein NDJ18_04565 [candidate division Zixibacteria bacterium]|nr:hypothetical protein [candidate division Zixibacteria bacterium]
MRSFVILFAILISHSDLPAQSRIIREGRSAGTPILAATFDLVDAANFRGSNDRLRMTIGDSTGRSFRPELSLHGLGQSSFRILLADSASPIAAKAMSVDSRDGLWFDAGTNERHLLYLHDSHSLEWEIVLDSVPKSHQFRFPIEFDNLSPHYQPELTEKEIADGHERPDSVVGSYAVYHPALGKLCHIFRPRAFDRDGNSAWCDLRIDSLLTIAVPPDFIASAEYPIRIDPTFGYTTAGASSAAILNTRCYGNGASLYRHIASAGERIDSFRVHMKTYSGNNDTLDLALYSWNSTLQSRLDTAVWAITSSGTSVWVTSAQTIQSLAAGTEYTLACNIREGAPRVSYDTGISGDHRYDNVSDLPSTWTEDGTGSYLLSMIAYYSVTSSTSDPPTRRRRILLHSLQ